MTTRRETVVLVAFTVETQGDENPQHALQERLHPLLRMNDETSPIESWWIAEDDRTDGSDNDSAVFVSPGNQERAARLLHAAGMTPDCNLVTPRGGQFAPPADEVRGVLVSEDEIDLLDDPWGLND